MSQFTVHIHKAAPGVDAMSPDEIAIAKALRTVRFLAGCWDKRFARELAWIAVHMPDNGLSMKQRHHLWRLKHRYRRQLPAAIKHLVEPKPANEVAGEANSDSQNPSLPPIVRS